MTWYNPKSWFRDIDVEHKVSEAGPIVSMPYVGRPVWSDRDYANFAREAFVINAVAYRCVKLIAGSASTVSWLLKQGDREIQQHDLLKLLDRPSPTVGGSFFFEALYAYLLLSGNTYVEGVGPKNKAPKELWNLRPDRMKPIPGRYGLPSSYEYEVNGQTKTWQVDEINGTGPIFHLREFHPINDWYGMSRVEPAAMSVDRHNAASAHNKALLDNGARPSGALVFEPVSSGTGQPAKTAPAEVIKAAEERLKERYGGPDNAGKPLVLGGNVKWEEMGFSPKDMDFGESKNDAARDICTAFGVPHILIVPGSATYNNYREAKLELWEETILPLIDRTKDGLNIWLGPKFGENLMLEPDLDSIPALEPRRESKRKTVVELMDKGLIDDDEAREMLQFPPRKPDSIGNVDAQILKVLVDGVSTVGHEPLIRYMRSVGLFDPTKTMEQMIADALNIVDVTPPADVVDALPPPANKAAKKTLYVHRKLLNAAELIKWAKDQGFDKTLTPGDLHVTVAFSKDAFDWSNIDPDPNDVTISGQSFRKVDALGADGAVVLHFSSAVLKNRWKEFIDAGASWDFDKYRPHVSITYDGGNVDLASVEPFIGELKFGPEIFSEISTGAMDQARMREKTHA